MKFDIHSPESAWTDHTRNYNLMKPIEISDILLKIFHGYFNFI